MNEMTIRILDVVNKCINSKEDEDMIEIDNTQLDDDLVELGVDSITFIRIVVELEELFEIEIPDEKLLITEMGTIHKLLKLLRC